MFGKILWEGSVGDQKSRITQLDSGGLFFEREITVNDLLFNKSTKWINCDSKDILLAAFCDLQEKLESKTELCKILSEVPSLSSGQIINRRASLMSEIVIIERQLKERINPKSPADKIEKLKLEQRLSKFQAELKQYGAQTTLVR